MLAHEEYLKESPTICSDSSGRVAVALLARFPPCLNPPKVFLNDYMLNPTSSICIVYPKSTLLVNPLQLKLKGSKSPTTLGHASQSQKSAIYIHLLPSKHHFLGQKLLPRDPPFPWPQTSSVFASLFAIVATAGAHGSAAGLPGLPFLSMG